MPDSAPDVRIDEVVVRTLQQEPALRYQHVSEMKTDVNRIHHSPAGAPVPAEPASHVVAAPRRARGVQLAVVALVLVVLVTLAIFALWKRGGGTVLHETPGTPTVNPSSTPAPLVPAPAPAPEVKIAPALPGNTESTPPIETPPAKTGATPARIVQPPPMPSASKPVPADGVSYRTGFEEPSYPPGRLRRTDGAPIDGHWKLFGVDKDAIADRAVQIQNKVTRGGSQALMVDSLPGGPAQLGVEMTFENSDPYVVIRADIYLQTSSKQSVWVFTACDPGTGGDWSAAGFNIFGIQADGRGGHL